MSGAGRLRVHLGGDLHGGGRRSLGVDGFSRLLEVGVRVLAAIWRWLNNHPFPPSAPVRYEPHRWMWTDDDDADFASFVRSQESHG